MVSLQSKHNRNQYLSNADVDKLCGVSKGITRFLNEHGVYKCSDMKKIPISILSNRFGNIGKKIWLMANGEDFEGLKLDPIHPKSLGHGKVVIRVAGAEIKMERHLLGYSKSVGLSKMKAGPGNEDTKEIAKLSNKEKRMLKIIEEELVDLKTIAPSGGIRFASNTCDVRDLTFGESKSCITAYLDKFIDRADQTHIFYLNHGNSKGDKDKELKQKIRLWLQTYPLIKRAKSAKKEDGGDGFTIVEIDS